MRPQSFALLLYYLVLRPVLRLGCLLGLNRIDLRFRDPSAPGWHKGSASPRSGLVSRPPPALRFRPHPYWLYENDPGFRSRDGRTRHNRMGFRGPDITPLPDGNTCRIVCLGESSTYGFKIIDNHSTYPARLQSHLHEAHGMRHTEVINAGVDGTHSGENLMRLIFQIAPIRPHTVVYYFTHNDIFPRELPWISRDYREWVKRWIEYTGDRASAKERIISGRLRRTSEVRRARQESYILHNPPDAVTENFRAMAAIASGFGFQLVFLLPTYYGLDEVLGAAVPNAKQYMQWAVRQHREAAVATGCPCFDLHGALTPPDSKIPTECFVDKVHFNEYGADRAAALFAAFLATRLQESR